MDKEKNLIPEDDYEYEKMLAQKAKEERKKAEQEKKAYEEKQKQLEKQREKRLQAEKIELMKLKSGVIEESETIKEEHDQIRELHGFEKVTNIWYHYKWIILFIAFIIAVCVYITYNTMSSDDPDLTVMMIANNGLQYRQEELEDFFEKYTEDLNDDGEVKVTVVIAPMDSGSTDQLMLANQTKVFGTIQSGDAMLFITDSNTDKDIADIMKSDLSKDFPDNKYITEQGLSLNMELFADEVEFENMPNDVVLSIRQPMKTINCSLKDMEEKYDESFKIFKAIADDLTQRAEQSNDPGLTTEPLKKDSSSVTDSSSKDQSEAE